MASNADHSFAALRATKECVIAIPALSGASPSSSRCAGCGACDGASMSLHAGHRHIRLAIRGWTLRDGNVRDGHPAVLGLYPIPIGEKAGGQKHIPPNLSLSACHEELIARGRISVTRPDGIALYHNSGSVPNPSLTARAAQLVPCEVLVRSLNPSRAWCRKT